MTALALAKLEQPAARAATCFHCGLEVPEDCTLAVAVEGVDRPVCCHGCAAAVTFLQDAGLDAYYRMREAMPLARPGARGGSADRSAWADPEVAKRFVHEGPDGARVALALDGVRCAACAWVIEQGLTDLDGVLDARVNVADARLEVRWDASRSDLDRILRRVIALGFDAVPARGSEEAALHARQRRQSLRALGISGIATMQIMMLAIGDYVGMFADMTASYRALLLWAEMVLASVVVVFGARTFLTGALAALKARRLTMDVPVALAIGVGYGASLATLLAGHVGAQTHLYFDSVSMFTFLLLVGRHLEQGVRHRFARADQTLGALLPAVAHRIDEAGAALGDVVIDALRAGDQIRVQAGETIPADAEIVAGRGLIDRAILTGESDPEAVGPGDPVLAGTRSLDVVLDLVVTRASSDSAVAGIPELLRRARGGRPRVLRAADRIAGRFLGAVLAACTITGIVWSQLDPGRALEIVLATLIVTCPCALSLAAPTAITAAGAALRRAGVLLVDPDALERIAACNRVAFDKTGTLTEPDDRAIAVDAQDGSALAIAAALDADVAHPVAAAFRRIARSEGRPALRAQDVRTSSGEGVEGRVDGIRYRLGHPRFVGASGAGIVLARETSPGARNWTPIARFRIAERLRAEVPELVRHLREAGLEPALVSGDTRERVAEVATQLALSDVVAEASPADKVAALASFARQGERVLYIGDGINDAPALGGAHASVAVGASSDYARSAADAVLVSPGLSGLAALVTMARATRRRIRANLLWAVTYNAIALPLAMLGWVTPWMAAIGMSASSLVVLSASLRLLRLPEGEA
jgi:Cu2+-exporting ATPase